MDINPPPAHRVGILLLSQVGVGAKGGGREQPPLVPGHCCGRFARLHDSWCGNCKEPCLIGHVQAIDSLVGHDWHERVVPTILGLPPAMWQVLANTYIATSFTP